MDSLKIKGIRSIFMIMVMMMLARIALMVRPSLVVGCGRHHDRHDYRRCGGPL
jgi:hypothetical protein